MFYFPLSVRTFDKDRCNRLSCNIDSVVSLTGNRIIHFHRVVMATLRTRLKMDTEINKYVYLAMTLQEIIKEKAPFTGNITS